MSDKVSNKEVEKYLENKKLSLEELSNVSGGGLICDGYPENPPCPECGSTDTYTGFDSNNSYTAHCRTCGHGWIGRC